MTMHTPKVMILTPINRIKDYVVHDFINHVKDFTYPNFELVLCDNSADYAYRKEIGEKYPEIKVLYQKPTGDVTEDICNSQNRLRNYFLQNVADYAFMLECDNFPTVPDVIEKLMSANTDAIAVLYPILQGAERQLMLDSVIQEAGLTQMKRVNEGLIIPKLNGNNFPGYAAGLGCALFKRSVIAQIPFRINPSFQTYSDTFFYQDLYDNFIDLIIDGSMICEHRNEYRNEK
jgi:hypothetical protein